MSASRHLLCGISSIVVGGMLFVMLTELADTPMSKSQSANIERFDFLIIFH